MFSSLRFLCSFLVICAVTPVAGAGDPETTTVRSTEGWAGKLKGTWHWRMPDTPNGLHPTQSWHATGRAPNGDIYISGMDHQTNSALYRIQFGTNTLRYVGDARTASEDANNWLPGETAQKFHTRPLWHRGKIYVATMDRSELNDDYMSRRGFHWYAYDPAAQSFKDLSASVPGGTAVPHGNLVSLASDPTRNVIYGAGVPTGELYRYDVTSGQTLELGRPASYKQPYVYTGRVMWVGDRGRLYFTASNSDEPAVHDHVHYYDPETGFGEEKAWILKDGLALETGQCMDDGKWCIFGDDRGHIYRFDRDDHRWSYLGKVETGKKAGWGGVEFWLFDVAPDGLSLYVGTSTSPKPTDDTALYKFDLKDGHTQRICAFAELDPALAQTHVHTGYDAWDDRGRLYFASFGYVGRREVIVSRIDPKELENALTARQATDGGTKSGR